MATAASMTFKDASVTPQRIQLPESLFANLMDCHEAHMKHLEELQSEDPKNREKFEQGPDKVYKEKRKKETAEVFEEIKRKEQKEHHPEPPPFTKPKKVKTNEPTGQPIFPPHPWPPHMGMQPHMFGPGPMGHHPHPMMGGHPGMPLPGPMQGVRGPIDPIAYQNYMMQMQFQQQKMQKSMAMTNKSQVSKNSPPAYPGMPSMVQPHVIPKQMGPPPLPTPPASQKTTSKSATQASITTYPLPSTSSQSHHPSSAYPMGYPMSQNQGQGVKSPKSPIEQQYQQIWSQNSNMAQQPQFKVPMTPSSSAKTGQQGQNQTQMAQSAATAHAYYQASGMGSAHSSNIQPPPSYPYPTGSGQKEASYGYPQTPSAVNYPNWPQTPQGHQQHQPPPYYPATPAYPDYPTPQSQMTQNSYYGHMGPHQRSVYPTSTTANYPGMNQAQAQSAHQNQSPATAQNFPQTTTSNMSQGMHAYPSSVQVSTTSSQNQGQHLSKMDSHDDEFAEIHPMDLNLATNEEFSRYLGL